MSEKEQAKLSTGAKLVPLFVFLGLSLVLIPCFAVFYARRNTKRNEAEASQSRANMPSGINLRPVNPRLEARALAQVERTAPGHAAGRSNEIQRDARGNKILPKIHRNPDGFWELPRQVQLGHDIVSRPKLSPDDSRDLTVTSFSSHISNHATATRELPSLRSNTFVPHSTSANSAPYTRTLTSEDSGTSHQRPDRKLESAATSFTRQRPPKHKGEMTKQIGADGGFVRHGPERKVHDSLDTAPPVPNTSTVVTHVDEFHKIDLD